MQNSKRWIAESRTMLSLGKANTSVNLSEALVSWAICSEYFDIRLIEWIYRRFGGFFETI